MVDPEHSFHIADYIVFAITIVCSIGIGIYYALTGDRQRTTTEYLVGGRAMKFLPVAISLVVSFESSIMMLGLPAEVYIYGIQWWLCCVGYLLSNLLSILIIVPLLHPLRITSAYEYLQLRFNSTAVRLLGSFLGMLSYIWYMGIVLFGPAIALEAVTGFPQWSSIFVVAFVAIIYTSIGGLKAVIWTDVFQASVMYTGMLAILIKGTLDVGGPSKVWEIASRGKRLDFFNFDPRPTTRHTFWNLLFGSFIRSFSWSFNQSTVQRISSTRTKREASLVLLITAPCFFVSLSMACYEGVVAFSYYQTKGCDPLAAKKITDPNQIIPFTVMDIFKSLPGMPGLFLASLFSASLSTLSSGLSSLSALLWTDFIKPRVGEVSEFKATLIAKISVVFFGLSGCGVALLVSLIGGTLIQISNSLLAAFGGPLCGLFILGCFCPWANAKGTFAGGLLSMIFTAWISLGSNFSKSRKKTPWLPSASTAKCLANQSASFFGTTASSLADMTTDAMLTLAYPEDDGHIYDVSPEGGDHGYSAVSASVLGSTTVGAIPDAGPQGVEVMYTVSYQLLAMIGIFVAVILGTVISLLTGGNREGEVHPRYLISFCDHLCCFLPEAVRKLFRCGKDYSSVKEDLPAIHDLFLDKEMTITDPTTGSEKDGGTLTLVTELTTPSPGSDVKPGTSNDDTADVEPQNGGASMDHSATIDDVKDDDDNDDGDVPRDTVQRKMEGGEGEEKG